MSHQNPLRYDKTCLNCNHVVAERFCPNCGQENIEHRKTFHQLFIHFFEDLTHYENAFWRTIKNLIFQPAALTREYLSGKRLSYLAPVRLYIFISFVTFFAFAIIPDPSEPNREQPIQIDKTGKKIIEQEKNADYQRRIEKVNRMLALGILNAQEADSVKREIALATQKKGTKSWLHFGYKSVRQIDSLYQYEKGPNAMTPFEYRIVRKAQWVNEHNSGEEIGRKFKESFVHNFPKVLFVYMPIFAFFLWLFEDKKRWYYFDHGIFTLHYFSFLLLVALILFLINRLLTALFGLANTEGLISLIYMAGFLWMFYYFFPAHYRFYGQSKWVSLMKSSALFVINFIFMTVILLLFMVYTFINLE